jgi:hypothetical protein
MPPIKTIQEMWGDMIQKNLTKLPLGYILNWEGQLDAIIKYQNLNWFKRLFTKRPYLSEGIVDWIKSKIKSENNN